MKLLANQNEPQIVDRLAVRLRGTRATPAHRDLMAAAGVACIVLAIALWQPLVGLATLGLVLIAVAFLAAPTEEVSDGNG